LRANNAILGETEPFAYSIALNIDVKFSKSTSKDAIKVALSKDTDAIKVTLTEEQLKAKYPMDYGELTAKCKERYSNFILNGDYHANKFDIVAPLFDKIQNNLNNLNNEVTAIKSKILDLAIRGKLVPQDPNDEPASVLLERIREEKEELIKQGKIKRDKMESVIFKGDDNSYYEKIGDSVACIDAELPFEIPDNWCWARLNCISINYDSYRKPINSYDRKNRVLGKSKDELYPYYGATGQIGFIDDFLFNGEYILLGEDAAPFLDKKAQKAYMIKGKSWVNNHAHILQSLVFPEYLTNCLNSIDYFDYVFSSTSVSFSLRTRTLSRMSSACLVYLAL
jgi:hypothetical protein